MRAVMREHHRPDGFSMSPEWITDRIASACIPYADSLVARARYQPGVIMGPSYGLNCADMSTKRAQYMRSCMHVPDMDPFASRAKGNARAIMRYCDRIDWVACTPPQQRCRGSCSHYPKYV